MVDPGITAELRGKVRVVSLTRPASAAMIPALRHALIAALEAEDGAGAVLIEADGAVFRAPVLPEPDLTAPTLRDLCRAVERCAVPVVVALRGAVVGPAAELALAAHARIVARDVQFALPDIGLGLPPEGGASQRLPRIIGPAEALRLLISGRMVPAAEALTLGLVDGVAADDPGAAALQLADEMTAGRRVPRPPVDAVAWQEAIAKARREARGARAVVGRIIDCVEAALLLPLDNGLAMEAVAREDMEGTPEVVALRAAARAERRAVALPPAVARLQPGVVQRVGLVGEGPGLVALAGAALTRGVGVVWVGDDVRTIARDRALVEARLTVDARGLLVTGTDPAALEPAGLVVHAARPVDGILRHSLPDTPHLVLNGPRGTLGLSLAPSGIVCELALPGDEAAGHVATAVATLRLIGIKPLLVGRRPVLGGAVAGAGTAALVRLAALGVPRRMVATALEGFGARLPVADWPDPPATLHAMTEAELCNRWVAALANAALRMLDEGIARRPSDVDYLMVAGYGFPRWRGGPMHLADQRGLIVLRRDLRLWAADDAVWSPAPLLDRLISEGVRLAALDG